MKVLLFWIASIAAAIARGDSTPSLRKRELAWGQSDGGNFYTLIAATDYSAMQGVEVQQSSEGITNVGFIDTDDWVAYPVNLPANGPYQFHARISSPSGEGSFEIVNFETQQVYAGFSGFPATADFQAYTTVDQTFDLPAGAFSLQLRATNSGFNMLWFSLKATPSVQPEPVEEPQPEPVEEPEEPEPVEEPQPEPVEEPAPEPVEEPQPEPVEEPEEPVDFPEEPEPVEEPEEPEPVEEPEEPEPVEEPQPEPVEEPEEPEPVEEPQPEPVEEPQPEPVEEPEEPEPVEEPAPEPVEEPQPEPVEEPEEPVDFPEAEETPAPTPPFFALVAAVDSEEMEGIFTETSSEGLPNLADFNAGDWSTYDISLPFAGTYEMMFRVASPNGDGGFDITNWDTQEIYSNIDVMPNTGDWQSYQTVSLLVNLPEGGMRMQLKCYNPGFNLLWFVIKSP